MESINLQLVPGLSQGLYVFDKSHTLLAVDAWKESGSNIGKNGEHLTISFLSMNRSSLSIRLLQSIERFIPHFAGEILIVDNGSSADELGLLRDTCSELVCRTRIVELGKNYGVAGGRNRTMPYVKTEWLMCLDNDIYFISNPLEQIQYDLAVLGCHFMSLPLLDSDEETIFARGGHIYISSEDGELHIGAGSAGCQVKMQHMQSQPFLGTFLFGGACVLNKNTFQHVGGYDEAMFVGFEDIDYSIRLFQLGYKVGAGSTFALVHDHPKPDNKVDQNYEKARFSRQVLQKSALHLESKHGFKIWSDAIEHWLESRHDELGLLGKTNATDHPVNVKFMKHKKPKIALIIDTDNWAFGNIARQLQRYLSETFEFVVIPMDIVDNIDHIFLMTQDCDIIHFFWREHLTLIGSPFYRSYAESLGIPYELFHKRFVLNKRLSTSVYDHLLLKEEEWRERTNIFSGVIAGYTVSSEKLNAIYSDLPGYPAPTAVIEDGVDLAKFTPKNLERFREIERRELVIGWVGNSKWASEIEDFKGVRTILYPAIDQLQQEGVRVISLFADRQDQFIPHAQMPDYYSKIDLYVCTSKIEGTPNPILEAMACGVPIISTDVGIVPQAFGELQSKFILRERSVDALKEKIKGLINNPVLFEHLSRENIEKIKEWDWSKKAQKFESYFASLLEVKNKSYEK